MVEEQIFNVFDKLTDEGKANAIAFAQYAITKAANRPKTPAERIDEWVAAGCVGDPDTTGFTLDDFKRLSEAAPARTY